MARGNRSARRGHRDTIKPGEQSVIKTIRVPESLLCVWDPEKIRMYLEFLLEDKKK